VFISPCGREKLELLGPRDGLYGFRLWQRKRNTWRKALELIQFDAYPLAVYHAAQQVNWVGFALAPGGDPRITYHLELHRGCVFRLADNTEVSFGNHDHCVACWATLSELDEPGVQHRGYVTHYYIPFGDGYWQWQIGEP
jgi:hypothetical protein